MQGYIKLWRQIEQSAVWQAGDGVFRLWCCLLMRASHKQRKSVVKLGRHSVIVDLQPGQYVIRERLLAGDLGIDRKTLRRRIGVLEDLECITLEQGPRDLRIANIINWQAYQTPTDGGGIEGPVSPPVSPPVSGPVSPPHHKNGENTKKTKNEEFSSDEENPPKQVWDGDGFPLSTGKVFWLDLETYRRYKATYAWDIDAELRKCAQWCREHREKRSRNATGMKRRITSWLNRADSQKAHQPHTAGDDNALNEAFAEAERIKRENQEREKHYGRNGVSGVDRIPPGSVPRIGEVVEGKPKSNHPLGESPQSPRPIRRD